MQCVVPDCTGESPYKAESTYEYAKYCAKHAARARRHGDPTITKRDYTPAKERWKKRVEVDEGTGCWVWTGTKSNGYGVISEGRKRHWLAHRLVWQETGHELVDGLELDHLCRNRACVNPDHLEQVPHAVNVERGEAGIKNSSKTHCIHGHKFTAENTIKTKSGGRNCRECQRKSIREYMQKRRAAQQQARGPVTHCKNGHEFTAENTYMMRNVKHCRVCASYGGKRRQRKIV